MAEGLIFPIGFDLDKAVNQGSKDWENVYASKLESALAKRAINIKMKLDTKNIGNLDEVKARLAQIKIEPITPETKDAIKALASELKSLAKALELVQKYSKFSATSKAQIDAAKLRVQQERANANAALAAQRAAKAEENLAAAKLKTARAANVQKRASLNSYNSQLTYLDRLIKRLAVYWSIQQVGTFLSRVREVTAQFELQRVSLGAIIQDQTRANQLFSEIKAYALKSPVTIMDLTKYTKQLAAYKIGVEDLFETTKRLTDVSVGLGVSMDRVVLAYGQVKATGYLRASEVRQFTEMGVPIVEELAAKLTKMNGELVTAADVMNKISERGISFQLVKEVFDDMTSSGGMFYNMQEKQGNTLFGMWAKLGDAASVMYDQIGNTESVNKGMKATIQMLTDLMRNWEQTARGAGALALVITGLIVRQKMLHIEMSKLIGINRAYITSMNISNKMLASNSALTRANGAAIGLWAKLTRTASLTAAAFGTSLKLIRAALLSTGIGALVFLLGLLIDKLLFTKSAAQEAADAVNNIFTETTTEQAKSVRNFEYLAKKAVESAEGSIEQKEALDELQRTYKDILPQELLEIDYLRRLNGNYESLTMSIRAYIAERQKQKAIDAVVDTYGASKRKYEQAVTSYMRDELQLSEQEIARFWENFNRIATDKSKKTIDVIREALKSSGVDNDYIAQSILGAGTSPIQWQGDISLYIAALREEMDAITQVEERHKAAAESANVFAEEQSKAAAKLRNAIFYTSEGSVVDRDTDLWQQMYKNMDIKQMTEILRGGFEKAGLVWEQEYGLFIDKVNESQPEFISTLNFDAIIGAILNALQNPKLSDAQREFLNQLLKLANTSRKHYNELVPPEPVVRTLQARFRNIAEAAGGFRQKYNQYLIQSGEDMATYQKRLKDEITKLKNRVKELLYIQKLISTSTLFKNLFKGEANSIQKMINDANKTIDVLEKNLDGLPAFEKKNKSGGKSKKDDPRLGILNEMVSTLKQINKEYDDLAKKEGSTKALSDVNNMYGKTLNNLKVLSKKYKFNLPAFGVPTDTSTLIGYLNKIKLAMKKLPKSDKNVLSLEVDINKINLEEKQKEIERDLQKLSDRISQTQAAKDFYDKILSSTGDIDLAASVTTSIYGDVGTDVEKKMRDYITKLFNQMSVEVPLHIVTESNIDYTALEKYIRDNAEKLGGIESSTYKELLKISRDGQKDLAKNYEGYIKDLAIAKTYADKRVELARDTANKIAEIEKSKLSESEKQRLIYEYNKREEKEAAKLEYDAFKNTPLYVQMFEDLDSASTTTLENMKSRLTTLKSVWGASLDPTQLKEMQSRLNDIENKLRERNPFKTLIASYKEFKDITSKYTISYSELGVNLAKSNLEKAQSSGSKQDVIAAEKALKIEKTRLKIVKQLTDQRGKQLKGQKALDKAISVGSTLENKARKDLEDALDKYKTDKSEQNRENVETKKEELKIVQEINNIIQDDANNTKDLKKSILAAGNQAADIAGIASDFANSIAGLMEEFGGDEEDVQYWQDIAGAMDDISSGISGIVQSAMAGNVTGIISNILTGVPKMIIGFSKLFSAGKTKRANKEIKKQQELLKQLEYTYSRLEAAQDKLFGADYLKNYDKQLKNLQAQQQAYLKMAQAERSKGKDEDRAKTEEYLNQARDIADKIQELKDNLVAQIVGTDVASAARDFANAWLDAYLSFDDTSNAISGKFNDMMKSMLVNMALGEVVKRVLEPFFNMIDKAAADENITSRELSYIMQQLPTYIQNASDGLDVAMESLKAAGFDLQALRRGSTELTGISRDISTASEESINGLAAGINTQNFYISQIHANVALIAQLMQGGNTTSNKGFTMQDLVTLQNNHLQQLPIIAQNTAETVIRCERAATACENMAVLLGRVIKPRGTQASHSLSTTIN